MIPYPAPIGYKLAREVGGDSTDIPAPTLTVSVSGTTATITADAGIYTAYIYYASSGDDVTLLTSGAGEVSDTLEIGSGTVYGIFALAGLSNNRSTPVMELVEGSDTTASSDTHGAALIAAALTAFGKTATYKPSGGSTREIVALINNANAKGLHGGVNSPHLSIWVRNSLAGISTAEVSTGKDKVSIATRYGETAQDRLITKIIESNPSFVKYEVR